jgi:acetolactate synthase-1/2/3 large subunit
MKELSELTDNDDIIITDAGANLTQTMQGYSVKGEQKLYSAFGHSPMGYSFPAAIGASFARNKKRAISIIGDGGMQMNIQEMQTIHYHNLPIKVFILNNKVYGIIKQFQDVWFNSKYEAITPESGYSAPDFVKIAAAYGIKTIDIRDNTELRDKINETLNHPGPVICNVNLDVNQMILPKLEFGKPIEDLSPLLDRDELLRNMIVKPITD